MCKKKRRNGIKKGTSVARECTVYVFECGLKSVSSKCVWELVFYFSTEKTLTLKTRGYLQKQFTKRSPFKYTNGKDTFTRYSLAMFINVIILIKLLFLITLFYNLTSNYLYWPIINAIAIKNLFRFVCWVI